MTFQNTSAQITKHKIRQIKKQFPFPSFRHLRRGRRLQQQHLRQQRFLRRQPVLLRQRVAPARGGGGQPLVVLVSGGQRRRVLARPGPASLLRPGRAVREQDADPQPDGAVRHPGQGDHHRHLHVHALDVLAHAHAEGLVQAAQGVEREKEKNGKCCTLNSYLKRNPTPMRVSSRLIDP